MCHTSCDMLFIGTTNSNETTSCWEVETLGWTKSGTTCPDCVRVVADDFGYVMPGQRQRKVSERRWWVPSTMWRQVTRNALNNSGDGALTMVPLCRGLSGTKITLGRRWKSRGQVGQTMDVTGGFIYYLYLPDDSSQSHLIWLRGWRSLCY